MPEKLCYCIDEKHAKSIKRQARKLLPRIVGGKNEYRQFRDKYLTKKNNSHILARLEVALKDEKFPRSQQLDVLKYLTELRVISNNRQSNWIKANLEMVDDPKTPVTMVETLMRWATETPVEIISERALSLLLCLFVVKPDLQVSNITSSQWSQTIPLHNSDANSEESQILIAGISEKLIPVLLHDETLIEEFIEANLIRSPFEHRREMCASLIKVLCEDKNLKVSDNDRMKLATAFHELKREAERYGSRSREFFQCQKYFAADLNVKISDIHNELNQALSFVYQHNNYGLYSKLEKFEQPLKEYVLESEPCLVCHASDNSYKLMTLNDCCVENKQSTNAHYLKLNARYSIQAVQIKVTQTSRVKLIRSVSVEYTTKQMSSQALRNNDCIWWPGAQLKDISMTATNIEIDLKIPIVAQALRITYTEFHEKTDGPIMLTCARCPHMPPTTQQQCSSCSESLLQCDKCRNINYDEKQPFLCKTCGYSKYAKLDINILGKKTYLINSEGTKKIDEADDEMLSKECQQVLKESDAKRAKLYANRLELEAMLSGLDLESIAYNTRDTSAHDGGITPTPSMNQAQLTALNFDEKSLPLFNSPSSEHFNSSNILKHYQMNCEPVMHQLAAALRSIHAHDYARRPTEVPHPYQLPSSADCYTCLVARCDQKLALLSNAVADTKNGELNDAILDLAYKLLYALLRDKLPHSLVTSVTNLISSLCKERRTVTHLVGQALLTASANEINATQNYIAAVVLQSAMLEDGLTSLRINYLLRACVASIDKQANITTLCLNIMLKVFDKLPSMRKSIASNLLLLFKKPHNELTLGAQMLMHQSCAQLRRACCNLYAALVRSTTGPVRLAIVNYMFSLISYLPQVGTNGVECASLIITLVQKSNLVRRIAETQKLAPEIGKTITSMVQGGFSDTGQAFALDILAELLIELLERQSISAELKATILEPVLAATLTLYNRLGTLDVVSYMTHGAMSSLLAVLGKLTNANDEDAKKFIRICVRTLCQSNWTHERVPTFIFDRLASTIHTTDEQPGTFYVHIEKSAVQEEYLPNRMNANPYRSDIPGMGPLMRDIKKKICIDTEMASFVDDDNSLDLLVDGQVISLDLPVIDVYRRLWAPKYASRPMHITYRVRGLQESTEPFVSTLTSDEDKSKNLEEGYLLARELLPSGGLTAVLDAFKKVRSNSAVLSGLHLLLMCVRNEKNCAALLKDDALYVVLDKLSDSFESIIHECASTVSVPNQSNIPQIIKLASILVEHAVKKFTDNDFDSWSNKSASSDHVESILDYISRINDENIRKKLIQLVTNVSLGNIERMNIIINDYMYIDFDKFDTLILQPHKIYGNDNNKALEEADKLQSDIETFCALIHNVDLSARGGALKDLVIQHGITRKAIDYLTSHSPNMQALTLTVDSAEMKEFLNRRSLKLILQLLSGLCKKHKPTQEMVAKDCIPIIHRLEGISTDYWSGSLAEELLDALKENREVANKIEEVRKETKKKKREQAMMMRQKQLAQMNMKTNASGQVRVNEEANVTTELIEEEGNLICSICREGFTHQPTKVLCAYVFVRRVAADDTVLPMAFTVTQFILVHFDCHQAAVKHARSREEWATASLNNQNVPCNALLPLYGPKVAPNTFEMCLARYQSDVLSATSAPEHSPQTVIHDLKYLLQLYVKKQVIGGSWHGEGGGTESNINLIVCHLLICVHMLNDASFRNINLDIDAFANCQSHALRLACGTSESSEFYTVAALLAWPYEKWRKNRMQLLKRLVASVKIKNYSASTIDFDLLHPSLSLFTIVDTIEIKLMKETLNQDQLDESIDRPILFEELEKAIRENLAKAFMAVKEPILRNAERIVENLNNLDNFKDIANLSDEELQGKTIQIWVEEALAWADQQ